MPEQQISSRETGGSTRTICAHGYSKESLHCDGPYVTVSVVPRKGKAHG